MTAIDAKVTILADKLQMVQCNCPPAQLKAVVNDVYALFAAQVPTGDPTPQQQQDMMDTLSNPGWLHRVQLHRIVARHVPLFHREPVIAAALDMGQTITLDDCFQAMREGRQAPSNTPPTLPTATARSVP